ncbi:type IV secretion system DNA-binding domain-containing protein [bacterium]|nr:type IV secretion system DNA-binding domain-containing protein [bacterium]
MLISIMEKLAIKIFEKGQKKFFSSSRQKMVSHSGLYIGRSPKPYNPREEENIFLSQSEREGHWYIVGGTGSGKTNFIENCVQNDIVENRGMCIFDAHGDISEKLVIFIASLWQKKTAKQKEEMARRLILVEPFHDRITGFNPMEVDSCSSALQMMDVFKKRWPDFGPRMEELFRACLATLSVNHLTLLELPILLTNREARDSLVKNITNQEIKSYWLDRYNKLSQGSEVQYREPVLNKVTEFLTDENVRYMLGQTKSTLDFRKAMDEGYWVILNISKGRLKNSASLLGGLLLLRLQLDGLSRANIPLYQRRSFYVYLDEFQNFINTREGTDIEVLLSEARKYRLNLTMANQTLSQLENSLLNAILGNISALFCFRLGYRDALALAQELNPTNKNVICNDLIKLKTGEAYFKLKGNQARPVKIPLSRTPYVHPKVVEEFKKLSFSFSTRPLEEVKREIEARHRKLKTKNRSAGDNYRFHKENPSEGQNGW